MHLRLTELSTRQREQLAVVANDAAQQHAPDWLPNLAAAHEELHDALEPEVFSRVTLDSDGNPIGYAAAEGHGRPTIHLAKRVARR